MTLTEFLLARIAEDEAGARAATRGPWAWSHPRMDLVESILQLETDPDALGEDDYGECVACFYGMDHIKSHAPDQADADHIVRWDPSRVLAECEAKRRIVEWCSGPTASEWHELPVLAMLALPYADHPDYDEAWRP
jgi:hypothetical protein